MRPVRIVFLSLLAIAPAVVGCTCQKSGPGGDEQAGTQGAASTMFPDASSAIEDVDLFLHHHALFAFGNTTPLPISNEFSERVPEIEGPLAQAAKARALLPVRIRVDRDVPYGQLTRLMQAGFAFRILNWHVVTEQRDGILAAIDVKAPGPVPRDGCYATAWCGPDLRVQVGIDAKGVIVTAKDGAPNAASVARVLRRMDARCAAGPVRIYAQPTGSWDRPFDLALGLAAQLPAPHVSMLQLQVPSLGPMDSPEEVVP